MSETSKTAAKTAKGKGLRGVPGWESTEAGGYSRAYEAKNPDQATKTAGRILTNFHKAGQPVEVHVEGAKVTARINADGRPNEELVKVMKRVSPKAGGAAKAEGSAAAANGDDD